MSGPNNSCSNPIGKCVLRDPLGEFGVCCATKRISRYKLQLRCIVETEINQMDVARVTNPRVLWVRQCASLLRDDACPEHRGKQ